MDIHPGDEQGVERGLGRELGGRYDLLGRDDCAFGRHRQQVIEIGVGAEELGVAGGVGTVDVHEREVEIERRCGHVGLIGVRGGNQFELRVGRQHVRAQPRAGGEEVHALDCRAQSGHVHPLVVLADGDRPALAGGGEQGVEWNGVEGDEAVNEAGDLPRLDQEAHVGAAEGDDGEVLDVGAQQGAHERHRLAAGSPPAQADGHAGFDQAHGLINRHGLIGHLRSQVADGHEGQYGSKPSTWLVSRLAWAEISRATLRGKTMEPTHTVVTGGASGIGRAVVEDMLARGERVTVFDLEPGSDPVPGFVAVDITEEEAVAEAFDQAMARAGVVQRLVASAGTRGEFVPALEMDPGRMRRVLEVNVLGTFIPAREMVRRLEGRGGSIVALSSTTAYRGWAKQADYGTSKAAVASLVEHLAVEWAPLGVRVNAVAPGHTLTPMVEAMVATGYDLD